MRSSQTEKPTPGIGFLRAEQRQQPVVAAAAGQRPLAHRRRDLEDQAGVIVERAAEGGVVADRVDRQAVRGDRLGARGEIRPAPRPATGRRPWRKPASASAAPSSGTWMARKVFSAANASSGRRTLRSSAFSSSRRAISSGVRPAAGRKAGLLHAAAICAASASRSPSATSAATGSASCAVARRVGEVGQRRCQQVAASRRRGPAAFASRAAGQARPAPPRTSPGRRA